MARKPDDIIRVGDLVEIIDPTPILRWGYPMSKNDALEAIDSHENEIMEFLKKLDIHHGSSDHKAVRKIKQAMAYAYRGTHGFGGTERKLYYGDTIPRLKGEMFYAYGRHVVKTGSYYRSSGGYDSYYGDYWYEPGGLHNMETHVLFEFTISLRYMNNDKKKPNEMIIRNEDNTYYFKKEQLKKVKNQ